MIIPSIDLMDGKAVQLVQGREKRLEVENPLQLARDFGRFGEIAVVDLDRALGRGDNDRLVREICRVAECRVGGGVRSAEKAREWVSHGAVRVVVSTAAFEGDDLNVGFLEELREAVGRPKVVVALDAVGGEVVTEGWTRRTGRRVLDILPKLEEYAGEILFTCVEREGRMEGPDLETVRQIRGATTLPLTAAGGIRDVADVRQLVEMGVASQIGMALYTGSLSLADAFVECVDWGKGPVPTVTCDTDGQVLMVAYSSRESLCRTFETGRMWYESRSKRRLWMKGESSGNVQRWMSVRLDCDRDALLVTVEQEGPACHRMTYSCFGDRRFTWADLERVVLDRLLNPVPGSYTASLTPALVREKLLEEARELVEASDRDEIVWEAADVVYFLTALLASSEVEVATVIAELRRRRRRSR